MNIPQLEALIEPIFFVAVSTFDRIGKTLEVGYETPRVDDTTNRATFFRQPAPSFDPVLIIYRVKLEPSIKFDGLIQIIHQARIQVAGHPDWMGVYSAFVRREALPAQAKLTLATFIESVKDGQA